jgi:hypothetical protein
MRTAVSPGPRESAVHPLPSLRNAPRRLHPARLFWTALVAAVPALSGTVAVAVESQQIWLDYNPSFELSPGVRLFGDVGFRRDLDHTLWWRLVLRPGVGIPAGRFRLSAGVGNFFTFSDLIANRWEIRPYQGVAVVWPRWRRFACDHYLRLEEQFNFNTATWRSLNALRLRYKLQFSYRWETGGGSGRWRAATSIEPFAVLASEQDLLQKKVRVTVAVERNLGAVRRLAVEVTWQQARYFFLPGEEVQEVFFRVRWYRRW